MRLGRATVVRERAKDRIGVDLIAGASEETAPVIVAQVVAKRGLGAGAKRNDVGSGGSRLKDGITDHQGAAIPDGGNKTRVAAQSTIGHGYDHVAVGVDRATAEQGRIAAHGAIDHGQRRAATVITGATDAAAEAIRCGVSAQSAVEHAQRREAAIIGNAGDAAAKAVRARCGVAAQSAIDHAQRRAAGDAVIKNSAAAMCIDR